MQEDKIQYAKKINFSLLKMAVKMRIYLKKRSDLNKLAMWRSVCCARYMHQCPGTVLHRRAVETVH